MGGLEEDEVAVVAEALVAVVPSIEKAVGTLVALLVLVEVVGRAILVAVLGLGETTTLGSVKASRSPRIRALGTVGDESGGRALRISGDGRRLELLLLLVPGSERSRERDLRSSHDERMNSHVAERPRKAEWCSTLMPL